MKRHMKHVKYTIPLLAILFGLIFVFGPSFSHCSVWEDLTGTGKKKDNSWMWLLLLLNQGGGVSYPQLPVGGTVTDSVPVGQWKFYQLNATTNGFYSVTLTDPDGTGPNDPDLYISYLGNTPSQSTSDPNWVASDTSNTSPVTISNYYINTSLYRIVGVYGKAAASGSTSVSFTLSSARTGDQPSGCSSPYNVLQNATPGTPGTNYSQVNVNTNSSISYFYTIVNNTASQVTITGSSLTNITSGSGDTADVLFYDKTPNNCTAPTATAPVQCNSGCNPAETLSSGYPVKPGDFHIFRVKFYDATSNGVSGNYTLSIQ